LAKPGKNTLIGKPIFNEPCPYLVFPNTIHKRSTFVECLPSLVIIPAFSKAYEDYELPQVSGGAKRAEPPKFRQKKDAMKGFGLHHEICASLCEVWETSSDMPSAKLWQRPANTFTVLPGKICRESLRIATILTSAFSET
jgi:hypothetical protein